MGTLQRVGTEFGNNSKVIFLSEEAQDVRAAVCGLQFSSMTIASDVSPELTQFCMSRMRGIHMPTSTGVAH